MAGPAPHLPSPKGKDKATYTQGYELCRLHRAGLSMARVSGQSALLTLSVSPSQELKKPCLARGQKDSEPPDPQMLHEHILRGTRAPGWRPGHPSPSPLPGLPSAAAQVFAQLLTQKCFISLPDPHVGKASHVKLRFFAVVWVERRGRVNTVLTQLLQAQVSSLDSGVHSSPPPPKIRHTPLCLTCCGH